MLSRFVKLRYTYPILAYFLTVLKVREEYIYIPQLKGQID
ncbi:hypothetical protein C8N25_10585 [Algoriphagus antarcticus]|uniref:Uncharacterized protein n=1 Tax=Algoriphagus antarcticus TaxID=238540 RepID=A0A3E0DY05_9BACT|nr:hypothetical protein C8N25_10585 [Algoriphagus antarcticus]